MMGQLACPESDSQLSSSVGKIARCALTGTFFCDRTTAQFFPRTPTDVIFAAVMALKAYSDIDHSVSDMCADAEYYADDRNRQCRQLSKLGRDEWKNQNTHRLGIDDPGPRRL
jgi:hypothetical protein